MNIHIDRDGLVFYNSYCCNVMAHDVKNGIVTVKDFGIIFPKKKLLLILNDENETELLVKYCRYCGKEVIIKEDK